MAKLKLRKVINSQNIGERINGQEIELTRFSLLHEGVSDNRSANRLRDWKKIKYRKN